MIKITPEIVQKEVSKRKGEIIEWLKSLVRFPSENRFPNGNEGEAQKFIEKECSIIGLKTDMFSPEDIPGIKDNPFWLNGRYYSNNRKNVVAKWEGIKKGKSLLFSGHVDVAPFEPDNWKVCRPYEPVEKDGKLYGRGTVDMKGGLASAYWAIRILKEIGFKPQGDIIFESVVDEEFAGGNGTLASRLKGYNADLAILTEPTRMQICVACLGAFLGDLVLKGKAGGMPFMGYSIPNPINGAARVIELFKEWEKYWRSVNKHDLFNEPGKELNILLWDIDSKIPGEFTQMGNPLMTKISWIVWSYPGMSEKYFYNEFKKFWEKSFKTDPILKLFEFEIIPTFHYVRPWESDLNDSGIQKLIEVYENYTKISQVVSGASLSCDMAIYGDQGKMPVIILGPSGDNIHGSDEWVLLEDIYSLITIFIIFINEWCG
ncbi:MAG: M20/M25/M40 family metallo-hydrolase [Actinobacteria bacterium]|nr:M20/M25/M40 family metallo-hydrolase [Cyanobacteriota bacterium]MCL5771629.1 M20/M25/M40 family metallo-hydrolase [Actinomycetota bacterium]